jgi:chromosome segregation ATPase
MSTRAPGAAASERHRRLRQAVDRELSGTKALIAELSRDVARYRSGESELLAERQRSTQLLAEIAALKIERAELESRWQESVELRKTLEQEHAKAVDELTRLKEVSRTLEAAASAQKARADAARLEISLLEATVQQLRATIELMEEAAKLGQ